MARQFLADALCSRHAGHVEIETLLVSSELVASVAQRVQSPITLSLQCWTTAVVVAVQDGIRLDVSAPAQMQPLTMTLFDKLTVGWGVDTSKDRLEYWCMVPTVVAPRDERLLPWRPASDGQPA